MQRKYQKEYKRYIFQLNFWIKRTKERMELLPEIEKLSKISYEEWCEVFKNDTHNKTVVSPPSPPSFPPPRIIIEDKEPPKSPDNK